MSVVLAKSPRVIKRKPSIWQPVLVSQAIGKPPPKGVPAKTWRDAGVVTSIDCSGSIMPSSSLPTESSALLSSSSSTTRAYSNRPMAAKRHETFSLNPVRRQLGRDHPNVQLRQGTEAGPISFFFNPTRATFDLKHGGTTPTAAPSGAGASSASLPEGAHIAWRARDNRKGRHILILPKEKMADEPPLTTSFSAISKGIWRMCTVYAWWDVSWWIAVLFTVGSAIFVVCGFFYWLPLADPSTAFPGEGIGGGLTAFIGATLFTIGGVLLIVEASNDNQTGCFGWALERAFTHSDSDSNDGPAKTGAAISDSHPLLRPTDCAHHHGKGVHDSETLHLQHPEAGRKWEWWPSWQELRDHYFHEMGFMASFILAIGAVIFYVSGIMALPWIYDGISTPVLYGTYWLAYLVGGVFFVLSSLLYMLETQPKWYLPAPFVLGWWIGTFNMIGSVGWVLSAAFGYCTSTWCAYQSDLSLLWASVAFMTGSALLWFEALDKNPVIRASK